MKRFYLLAIIMATALSQIQAQGIWNLQNSGTTEDLLDVDMFDAQTVRAVGTHSVFINTVTGGAIWNVGATASGNDVDWNAISFIGPLHGWLVGQNNASFKGPIWKTSDGGTFLPQLLYKHEMFDVKATSSTIAYVVCDSATILHTTNGGFDWNPITGTPASDNKFLGLTMYGGSTGFAVGEDGMIGKIMGASFTPQSSPVNDDLNSIFSIDADTAFACGENGALIYTHNGGTNWMDATLDSAMWGEPDLKDVYFLNGTEGMVIGEDGMILWTSNRGAIWTQITSNTTEDLNAMAFFGKVGFIVGDDGTILKNNDVTAQPFLVKEDGLNRVSFYPNPARTIVNFEGLTNEPIIVEVVNTLGQVIKRATVNMESPRLNLSALPSGHYILKMSLDNQSVSKSLLIKH